MKPQHKGLSWMYGTIIALFCLLLSPALPVWATANPYGVISGNPYVVDRFVHDGELIDEVIVPGRPPAFHRARQAVPPKPNPAAGTNTLSNVPAFDWSYGCSATSAAMMFGYYDNTGYPNLYTGPTNGGVMPMTNAVWGAGECPLSATHLGIDGRAIKGHVDDYWIGYGSTDPDPFIGNWLEHTHGDCTGDYMGTNQSAKSNTDGSTTFYYYTSGARLYDYTGCEPAKRDGCHGMRLFFESRGYRVDSNYSQYILGYNNNTQGFAFEEYKEGIDAGRPVLIQVEGHTMLGYGYNDEGTLVYLRDTWDYGSHSMTWGGSYEGMQHYAVTVFVPSSQPIQPTLAVTKSGDGSGIVTSSPAGISCGNDCTESYPAGTPVTLTAIAAPGSTFTGWSGGGCSGTVTCTVTMTADTTVTASFSTMYTLAVTKSGTGTGIVTSSPAGISCGATCSADFLSGTPVTLSAGPATDSTFTGWSGGGCSGTGTCTVTMNSATAVAAGFDLIPCVYTLRASSRSFSANGGSFTVNVTGSGQPVCPAPLVTEDCDWITTTSGTWAKNKGTVKVAAMKSTTSLPRNATVTIGGQPFAVTQACAACAITKINPTSQSFGKAAGSGSFTVTVAPADCAWTTTTTATWVHPPEGSTTGNGTVNYDFDANAGKLPRAGPIALTLTQNNKKKTFTVRQRNK